MASGPGALLLSRGSASLPQPRTLRTKMSGKNRGGFGIGRRLEVGWSILSPQPDSPVWAAWYLCSGNGTRQASFLSLPFSYSPRAEAESSPLSTYSHTLFKLAPALVTIPQIWCLLASPLG